MCLQLGLIGRRFTVTSGPGQSFSSQPACAKKSWGLEIIFQRAVSREEITRTIPLGYGEGVVAEQHCVSAKWLIWCGLYSAIL
jgi:hypothetical protein